MDTLTFLQANGWGGSFPPEVEARATGALEDGSVIVLPNLPFPMTDDEKKLLDPRILAKAKNVSYNPATGRLGGTSCTGAEAELLRLLVARYSESARTLVHNLFPRYRGAVRLERTSLRPAEIAGRASSWRKDDTRLHVDAFPSNPVRGDRIIRVFCNVNPSNRPRVWRLGEPF